MCTKHLYVCFFLLTLLTVAHIHDFTYCDMLYRYTTLLTVIGPILCQTWYPKKLLNRFPDSFKKKIQTIRKEFNDDPLDTTENFASSVHSSDLLSSFYALSEDQILKLIRESKSTTATVDPAPTKLVLEFTDVLLPVFQKIVNLSLTSGTVPIAFKKQWLNHW